MKSLLFFSSLVLLSGCATVFRGDSENISFTSNPTGAEVTLSSGQHCIAPCSLVVTRKGPIYVTYEMYGHKPFKTALPATIDGGSVAGFTAFNLVMLPIVNDVVDYNTRANYSRKPNPLHVEMIEITSESDYPAPAADESSASESSQASSDAPDMPASEA
jgi:PEGA domain-containing protein